MNRFGTLVAMVSAALLVVAAAVPVSARSPVGEASGDVTWDGQGGLRPGRTSVFQVRDGAPGEVSSRLDGGTYDYSEIGKGSLRMRVSCVRVDGNWAEFSGKVVGATGVYAAGKKLGYTFLVQVIDGEPVSSVDDIGMNAYTTLAEACAEALNDSLWTGQNGNVTGGDIRVHDPR